MNWTVASRNESIAHSFFMGANKQNPKEPNEEGHFSFCLHLGPRFTGRRADHQALGWRVEPRQRWTRCIAKRDEGGTGTMNQGTTGASSRPSPGGDASTSGANTAVGVNNTGTATQPGAVKDGVNKR